MSRYRSPAAFASSFAFLELPVSSRAPSSTARAETRRSPHGSNPPWPPFLAKARAARLAGEPTADAARWPGAGGGCGRGHLGGGALVEECLERAETGRGRRAGGPASTAKAWWWRCPRARACWSSPLLLLVRQVILSSALSSAAWTMASRSIRDDSTPGDGSTSLSRRR